MRRLFLLFLTAAFLAAGVFAYLTQVRRPLPRSVVFVDIPSGTSTRGIAEALTEAGVLSGEIPFLLVRAARQGSVLQAGEYRFTGSVSAWDAYAKIARGDIFYHEVRVPEGSNLFDIAKIVESAGLIRSSEFLRVARSPDLIRDIAPEAPSLEGFLFPSTYRVTKRVTAEQLARQMTGLFRRTWSEIAPPGTSVNRIVTLASLVEKETGVPAERTLVAGVYGNRLDQGIKLDCDPTTIYAALLEGRYRGTIYRSDLDNPHPYNTYQNPGLPPGPIANPGRDSLLAALKPAETDYIFFVAKPDGSGAHTFSRTLAEHSTAVEAYRRGRPD